MKKLHNSNPSSPSRGRMKVILTPMGNSFRYRIVGGVYCNGIGASLTARGIYRGEWGWKQFFSTRNEFERFLKKNKQISKIIPCNKHIHIHPCDRVGGHRVVSRDEQIKNGTHPFWYDKEYKTEIAGV